MADIIFNGNGPKPTRARVWTVQKEFTMDSPPLPCQLHAILEADMNDDTKAYKLLVINPGKCREWGCEPGAFETLFNSATDDPGELSENVEDFINEHADVEKLEDMFLC